ncbi:MAG TPA: FAD-binding oxidoreductase [Thermoanaerobaculia bacterium]
MAQKPFEDYGHLYRKDPEQIEQPRSLEALGRFLKQCNQQRRPVTLRNTAHSCNGQTLTNRVQLNLSALTKRRFDREAMTVTTEPGASWNFVLRTVDFPEFCTPLFPNNPGQRIHIGGTASVGGVGYYGSHSGGFWNVVRSIKLVTMEGDIIECSRDKNFDLMRFSLGGFGRLGVIGEMTIDVIPSKTHVLGMLLIYRCGKDFEHDMVQAMYDEELKFDGVAGQEDIPSSRSFADDVMTKLDLKILTVIKEVDPEDEVGIKNFVRKVRLKYPCGIMLFMKLKDNNLDVSLDVTTFKKKELVYFTPMSRKLWIYLIQRVCQFFSGGVFKCINQPGEKRGTKHPWTDCIVPLKDEAGNDVYGEFMKQAKELIAMRGFEKCISKQSIFHGLVNVDSFVTFLIRKKSDDFPVALDLPGDRPVSMGLAIMPDLPPEDVGRLPELLELCDELTNLTYAMGGRRYLYGYHRITRQQVIQQYGMGVIRQWNDLKKQVDPHGLLNMGVLEHLDEL